MDCELERHKCRDTENPTLDGIGAKGAMLMRHQGPHNSGNLPTRWINSAFEAVSIVRDEEAQWRYE